MSTRCEAPRAYLPDEEPDVESIDWRYYVSSTDCSFCGRDGHQPTSCPSRPGDDANLAAAKRKHTTHSNKTKEHAA